MKIKLLIHDDDVRDSSNKAAKQIFPLQCPLFSVALCIFRIIITHDLLNATKEYNLKKIYRCFLSIKPLIYARKETRQSLLLLTFALRSFW